MPLPPPPPLLKNRYRSNKQRALLPPVPLEEQPLAFPALEPIFYDQDISRRTPYRCRTCLKFHRCTLGPQQMLQCFAYFLWHPPVSTNPNLAQDTTFLLHFTEDFLTLPENALTPAALAALSVEQLLGLYFLRQYSLKTIVDISLRGLRSRLLEIAQDSHNPGPYLLTTE